MRVRSTTRLERTRRVPARARAIARLSWKRLYNLLVYSVWMTFVLIIMIILCISKTIVVKFLFRRQKRVQFCEFFKYPNGLNNIVCVLLSLSSYRWCKQLFQTLFAFFFVFLFFVVFFSRFCCFWGFSIKTTQKFSKLFNINNLKVSYCCCLTNISSIISSHNKKVLKS